MLHFKSVRSPRSKDDGFRILVTRGTGRFLSRTRYDAWMPNLGPTETLLADYRSGTMGVRQFGDSYRSELFATDGIDRNNARHKNRGQRYTLRLLKALAKRGDVTLMCHCPDGDPRCHLRVLEKILGRRDL